MASEHELDETDAPASPEPSTDDRAVLSEDDLRPPAGVRAPEPPPLAPWPQLWLALDDALRTPRPRRELDVDALVRRMARGELIRELPRCAGLVHARVALVVDRAPRLIPFWDDQVRLVGELARRLGMASLRLLPAPDAGASPRAAVDDDEVVFALSDLGFFADAAARAAWRRYGRDLRALGSRLLALVPCPARRWDGPLAAQWSAMDWGAPTNAPRSGAVDEDELRDTYERLLRLLSPATRIEPGLLRAIRGLVPGADAGTEADAWRHPEADGSSSVALCLDEKAARAWRRELSEDPLRDTAADLIRRWHLPLTPELQAEETVTLLAGGMPKEALGADRVRQALEIFERLATMAVTSSPDDSRLAAGVYAYARRFKNRASAEVWAHAKLRRPLARLMAALRRRDAEEPLPAGVTPEMLRQMTAEPDGERPRRKWNVWQQGDALRVRPFGEEGVGSLVGTVEGREPALTFGDGIEAAVEVDVEGESAELGLEDRGPAIVVASDLETVRIEAVERPAWASAAGRDRYGLWASFDVEGVVQRMRWIPPGRFWMGLSESEQERLQLEEPRHFVILTEGFWMGETPCIQGLWAAVTGENPSYFGSWGRPVEQVSWNDCQNFLSRLNEIIEGLTAELSTEAQWEYACRAGLETSVWTETPSIRKNYELEELAWYEDNCGVDFDLERGIQFFGTMDEQYKNMQLGTREVALKQPNPWGLYDTLGNVWEWCHDWYGVYATFSAVNPKGPQQGPGRVRRGGSWLNPARGVHVASRYWDEPGRRLSTLGFRLASVQSREASPAEPQAGRGREGVR